MNARTKRPLRMLAAAGLSATMLLASCSGDDDSATTTIGDSVPPTEAPDTTPGDTAAPETSAPGEVGFQIGYVRPAAGLLSQLAVAQETSIGLAVDDINDAGGVNGQPVGVLTVTESLDGDTGAAITDLLDQGADYIVGPVGSTGAKAALQTLAGSGAIACSASATSPELTTLDVDGVLYRTAMPDSFTVVHIADQITAMRDAAELPEGQVYRVSIMARADDYGINVGNSLTAALIARGIDASVIGYNPRRVVFSAEAAAVAAAPPDTVVLVSYAEGVTLLGSLVQAGVAPSSIIGLDSMFDPRLAERSSPSDPTAIDGVQVIGSTGDRAFIDRLVAVSDQVVFGAQAYDCAVIGALAAQASGSFDPAGFGPQIAAVTNEGRSCSTVADCLGKLIAGDDVDYEGLSGGVRFDEAGDPAEARYTTATFTDGNLTEVSTIDLDLDDLRQQEALATAIFTSRLQQLLTALGYFTGPIDGQWSDELTVAVAALQTDLGVPVTGVWDEATDSAARAKYGAITAVLGESVIGIQQLLTDLGFYTGPIDGIYSRETVEAIRALQRTLGVPETGILDAATLRAAYEQGIVTGTPDTTVPTETTVPPTTIAPPETTTPTETTIAPDNSVPTVDPPDPADPTVLEMLQADERFSTLVELLAIAGFNGDTEVLGPITLFAPTNEAFEALDPAVVDALSADPDLLARVLSFHLVEAGLTLDDLATLTEVDTVYGLPLEITIDGDVVRVGGAATSGPELRGRNGVVIAIDTVLQPPAIAVPA